MKYSIEKLKQQIEDGKDAVALLEKLEEHAAECSALEAMNEGIEIQMWDPVAKRSVFFLMTSQIKELIADQVKNRYV